MNIQNVHTFTTRFLSASNALATTPDSNNDTKAELHLKPEQDEPKYSAVSTWPGSKFLWTPIPQKTGECAAASTATDQTPSNPRSAFYQRKETPWRAADEVIHEEGSFLAQIQMNIDEQMRANYLNGVINNSNESLHAMYDDYHAFRQQLEFVNPELASKYFGFTLGPDLEIMVTDPDGVLTVAERSYLTEKLNERGTLKGKLHEHARTVMELVDHLSEKFGGRYNVTLDNYHKIIDYGEIFTRNTIGNFMDTWAYQVERYADKREDAEEKTSCRIDVTA